MWTIILSDFKYSREELIGKIIVMWNQVVKPKEFIREL
jgi:hypothetical protein